MKTTIAHIIIERLKQTKTIIDFPAEFQGDLEKEHNWALFSPTGPKLMKNYPEMWGNICTEIDFAINEGVAHFGDNGIITISQGHI
jgi:hypothetical protein